MALALKTELNAISITKSSTLKFFNIIRLSTSNISILNDLDVLSVKQKQGLSKLSYMNLNFKKMTLQLPLRIVWMDRGTQIKSLKTP